MSNHQDTTTVKQEEEETKETTEEEAPPRKRSPEEEEQIKLSVTVVDQLLKKHNFRRRQAEKTKATGSNSQRNEQFEKINLLIESYQREQNPVISMDTKKKKN